MKKILLAIGLLIGCSILVFAQIKPKLAILPFTGGTGGDGETIAAIFSNQKEILDAFIVVPRTSAINALLNEQNFQMSGYTDSDTIARMGRFLNADFVVSGHIRRLGNKNLVITTIVNVETFEQMAGDYRMYQNIEEVRNLIPAIAGKMIAASRRITSSLAKLAIAPFNVANVGVDKQNAETLAQILAVEITNTGKYIVLPRTTTIQAALQELNYQMSGYTAAEGAKAIGRAINANYVLFADARSLGKMNMFIAQILHVEDGSLLTGAERDYRVIDDGIKLMPELALLLTNQKGVEAKIADRNRERLRVIMFEDRAKFWSLGVSAGTSFATPWVIGTAHGTIAPLRYSYFEVGFDFGTETEVKDVSYYSYTPYIHYSIFVPFAKKGGWYIGAGGAYMITELYYPGKKLPQNFPAASFTTGFNIGNMLDISYTLRTNFSAAENKISAGYTYRFK